jgi:hypothetical protein
MELSLANHAVILSGSIGLEWKLFVVCVRYWVPALSHHVWRAIYSIRTRELYQLWQAEAKKNQRRIETPIPHSPRHGYHSSSVSESWRRRAQSPTANIHAVMFLNLSRYRLSSDPRDNIYALYHMMKDMGVQLSEPDYSISPQKLYEEVTFALIESSGSLWILENVSSHRRMEGLPSWVPDFSQETPPHELLGDYEQFFDGYFPSTAPRQLILDGKIIHVVKQVAERMPSPNTRSTLNINLEGSARCIARWAALALDPIGEATTEEAMRNLCMNLVHPNFLDDSGFEKRQTIMDQGFTGFLDILRRCHNERTPQSRGDGLRQRQQPAADQQFGSWWRGPMPQDTKLLVDEMLQGSLGHRLFVTSRGTFGLCKSDLHADDLIVLFPGTTAPMILRPTQEDNYQIVGRGSIHGIPRGSWPHHSSDRGMETFIIV